MGGQYDEEGVSPVVGGRSPADENTATRRLAEDESVRYGYACRHWKNETNTMWTKEYEWKHCSGMQVGATYEIHWPHSAIGACKTPWQFQSPFYDGVFCHFNEAVAESVAVPQNMANAVGVQAQVFTVVNDEKYYYPDLLNGAIENWVIEGETSSKVWTDVAAYTGSTTGTSRSNTICSKYSPITWQVDRT